MKIIISRSDYRALSKMNGWDKVKQNYIIDKRLSEGFVEDFKLYLARFAEAVGFFLCVVIMCPVHLALEVWLAVEHFYDIMRGAGSHDPKEHLMFWTWEEWTE